MPGVVHSLMNSEFFSWRKGLEIPAFPPGAVGSTGLGVGNPLLEYPVVANMLSYLGCLLPSRGLSFQIHKMGTMFSKALPA